MLVHMEIELFRKGIVCPQESGEMSLKNALSRLFAGHAHAVVTTNLTVLAVWRECGYFYLFAAASPPSAPAVRTTTATKTATTTTSRGAGPAWVRRFETFQQLYAAIVADIPRTGELGWFEIRRCDFTLTPVGKAQVIVPHVRDACAAPAKLPAKVRPNDAVVGGDGVAVEMAAEPLEPADTMRTARSKKCKSRKPTTTCFGAIAGTSNVMILRGTAFTVSEERDRVARRQQTAAIAIVALAMSFVETADGWSSQTLDLVVQAGRALYADARRLHGSADIRLHHLPRKIFVGEVPLELAILAATITEADLDAESLFEFFERHTMAYLVVNGGSVCRTLLRSLNQFYVFDAMPCTAGGRQQVARPEGTAGTAACVLRFGNFQRMLDHLQGHIIVGDGVGHDGSTTLLMGPIKCARDYQVE